MSQMGKAKLGDTVSMWSLRQGLDWRDGLRHDPGVRVELGLTVHIPRLNWCEIGQRGLSLYWCFGFRRKVRPVLKVKAVNGTIIRYSIAHGVVI